MHPRIRPAGPNDAPALAPLLAEVNDLHAAALPDRFRPVPAGPELEAFVRDRILQEGARTFVAEDAGAPVGFLVATVRAAPPTPIALPHRHAEIDTLVVAAAARPPPRRHAEIDTLVVAAAARRRGVGRALVDHAHRWIADQGIDDVHLVVYEFNVAARRFYERLGYATHRRGLWRSLSDPRSPSTPPTTSSEEDAHGPSRPAGEPPVAISPAGPDDAEPILKLQYLCYQSEAALYDDWALPPLTETLSDVRRAIATDLVLAARLGPEVVGSVRGYLAAATCHVGRLVVHPRLRRRGLAARLLTDLETRLPEADRFALFTGHRSAANLRLYQRLGYAESHRVSCSPHLQLVYLAKQRPPT